MTTTTEPLPIEVAETAAWTGTTPDPVAAAAAAAERRRVAERELAELRATDATATRVVLDLRRRELDPAVGAAGLDTTVVYGRTLRRVVLAGPSGVDHARKYKRVIAWLDRWQPEALTTELLRSIDRNITGDMWDKLSSRQIAWEAYLGVIIAMQLRGEAAGRAMAHPKSAR